ncbi:MAG: cupin domain-containing protein [Nanoarchaeota archaeon]|nr:cupin domain-containing protein [Nanoarchaeota archaeon]
MSIEVRKPTDEEKKEAESWGIWEKEESSFPLSYDEEETCLILEGKAEVTTEDGEKVEFGVGDYVVFPQGLKCTWKITSPIKKHYKFG